MEGHEGVEPYKLRMWFCGVKDDSTAVALPILRNGGAVLFLEVLEGLTEVFMSAPSELLARL